MKLCKKCVEAIKDHGEPILTYDSLIAAGFLMDEAESIEQGVTCEWCDEHGELYECLLD